MKQLDSLARLSFNARETSLAWCWHIVRVDKRAFGFTDHDADLFFDGMRFQPQSGMMPSEIRSGSDLSIDAQEAEGVLSSRDINARDIDAGLWDGATVEVWRVDWRSGGYGRARRAGVLMRSGTLGSIRRGRVAFVAEFRSLASTLDLAVGRTYQHACDATLGDARCGVTDPAVLQRDDATVKAVENGRSFSVGRSARPSGWFTFGKIEWIKSDGEPSDRTSNVLVHSIRSDGDAIITLTSAPPVRLATGTRLKITVGCNKRFTTCVTKFANAINFRGFPYIPGNTSVLRYAKRDAANTGEIL